MLSYVNYIIGLLPFSWVHYDFMCNAIVALFALAPIFSLLGTAVVGNRLVFFSDVVGHSALSGVALGVLFGIFDMNVAVVGFACVVALLSIFIKKFTGASYDTVLGVIFAAVVGLGVFLLSIGGGFAKYTTYLTGDLLAVSSGQILWLYILLCCVLIYWFFFSNKLTLVGISPFLARSRGINVDVVEVVFMLVLAVSVASAVKFLGVLLASSLLVLPAASARNICGNFKNYTIAALIIGLFSSLCGLIISFYFGSSAGAAIVLVSVVCYAICAVIGFIRKNF